MVEMGPIINCEDFGRCQRVSFKNSRSSLCIQFMASGQKWCFFLFFPLFPTFPLFFWGFLDFFAYICSKMIFPRQMDAKFGFPIIDLV